MELTAAVYYDELVARCKQGDVRSYELLYKQYAKAMFNTSLRIVNNRSDAEDVLQEAFVAAFRLENFDFSSTFGAWLKRIVVNKSIDTLRRRHMVVVEYEETAFQHLTTPDEENIEHLQLVTEAIKKAMTLLPGGYRTVLSLYLFEGYDHDEISSILNITPSTVRTQYHRAKQKLLQLLQKGGMK